MCKKLTRRDALAVARLVEARRARERTAESASAILRGQTKKKKGRAPVRPRIVPSVSL